MSFRLLLPFPVIRVIIICPFLVSFVGGAAVRAVELQADTATVLVNFTLQRVQSGVEDRFCNEGVDFPGNITLEVFYRVRDGASEVGDWKCLQRISLELPAGSTSDHSMSAPLGGQGTQVAVLQVDHAGGHCAQWAITNRMSFSVDGFEPYSRLVGQDSCAHAALNGNVFRDGSSSSLRGLITNWLMNTTTEDCNDNRSLEELFSLPDLPPLHNCSSDDTSGPYLDISFLIQWAYLKCDQLDFYHEGIELSLRRPGDLLWRPIAFFSRNDVQNPATEIPLGDVIRGYSVPHIVLNNSDTQHHRKFRICDDSIVGSSVQFRWLQTVKQNTDSTPRDVWSLDEVQVTVSHDTECSNVTVLEDDFEEGNISSVNWPDQRRAMIASNEEACVNGMGSLVWFGSFTQTDVQSRMIATRTLDLRYDSLCAPPPMPAIDLGQELSEIFNLLQMNVTTGTDALLEYVRTNGASVNETQVVYLTSVILDLIDIQSTTITEDFSQNYIGIAGALTTAVSSRQEQQEQPSSQDGSILLRNLDRFALNHHDPIYNDIMTDNLEFIVRSDSGEGGEVMVISDGGLSLTLPSSLFNSSAGDIVRYASSFLYRSMSGFLDNSLPGNESNESSLLGPVLSSFLHSDGEQLIFNNISPPVIVTFPYSNTSIPTCVFWMFDKDSPPSGGGSWNDSGCETQQNDSHVTCKCNHLTHFALLLSPGIELDEGVEVSLQIIGIVGVTVSVVALVLTILTFTMFRSLWSTRNYIHIQLCACLCVAQLLFVAGVEPRGSEAACSAVAVLLHYAFLVCFMWMLMEGVVLYVALVRVFVVHHLRYVIAFTVVSYGVPLVYMGLCIPLGFLLTDSENRTHYGSDEACWLRSDTDFIWAFNVPVLLIILVNCGFFVMALAIICRQQRRRTQAKKSNLTQIKHWIKVSVTLMVVMGITWAMGVLVFTESLLPLAYVFTIFVAFQGVIIFFLLVVLSEQVRNTYRKWWKKHVIDSEFSKRFSQRSSNGTSMTRLHKTGTGSSTMEGDKSVTMTSSSEPFILQSSKLGFGGVRTENPAFRGSTSVLAEDPDTKDPGTSGVPDTEDPGTSGVPDSEDPDSSRDPGSTGVPDTEDPDFTADRKQNLTQNV